MLAGTTCGAGAKTIRTSALALCYYVAEYCAPVWRNSAHTNPVDVQLTNTMMTITGAVRCTKTDWLPVLSSIAPADIRREVATSRMILRARGKHELPLLTDIDFHPRPRLKSRRPIWYNLPNTSGAHDGKSLMSQTSDWLMILPSSYREWTCPVANGAC